MSDLKVKLPDKSKCTIVMDEVIHGLAERYDDGTKEIVIDCRGRGKERLDTVIHELLHQLNWRWSEDKVKGQSKVLAEVLWKLGYRSNSNKLKRK